MVQRRFVACQFCRKPVPAQSPICPHCGETQDRNLPAEGGPAVLDAEPKVRPPSPNFIKKIATKMQRTKTWRVRTAEGRWVCPYCGEPAADRPAASLAARHLQECDRYQQARQARKKGLAIEELKARADLVSLREEAEYRLATSHAWNTLDLEGGWICPFCGQVPTVRIPKEGKVPEEALDQITEHLSFCRYFRSGQETGLPAPQLRTAMKRANAVVAAKRLARSQIHKKRGWQFWDDEGFWCCPFCADVTEVCVPHGAQISEDTLREMALHLIVCAAYGQGKGEPRTEDFLQKSLVISIRRKRMRRELERILTENPAWRHQDRFGKWVCPICQLPAFTGEPGATDDLAAALFPKVFEHITRHCPPFQSLLAAGPGETDFGEIDPDEERLLTLIRELLQAVEQATSKTPPAPPPPAPDQEAPLPADDDDFPPTLEGELV